MRSERRFLNVENSICQFTAFRKPITARVGLLSQSCLAYLVRGKRRWRRRVMSTCTMTYHRDHEFLVKIITSVGNCVHGYDQESSQQTSQSHRTSSPCPKMARQVCSNVNGMFGFTDIHLTCPMWICSKRTYPKTNISTLTPYGGCRKMWNQNGLKSPIRGVGRLATTLWPLAPPWTVVSFLLKAKYLSCDILHTCQIYCQVTSFFWCVVDRAS